MSDLFEILLFLAAIFAVVAVIVLCVRWILRPVDQAAKDLQRPTQFTIVDFLCLFFVLQLFMALTHSFIPTSGRVGMETTILWAMDIYGWISFGAMWMVSVQKLSRAAITHTWHRAAFLALVLPVAFFCSIAVPILVVVFCGRIIFDHVGFDSNGLILLALTAAGTTAIVLAGRYTRWMVAASKPAA